MRLGQVVYWIETERPSAGAAGVYIRQGQFFGRDRDTVSVQVHTGTGANRLCELRALSVLMFEDRADAEAFAFGTAVRLVNNFNYPVAVVADPTGKILYTHKPTPDTFPKGTQ